MLDCYEVVRCVQPLIAVAGTAGKTDAECSDLIVSRFTAGLDVRLQENRDAPVLAFGNLMPLVAYDKFIISHQG